jgi:hypothetical protein
MPHWITGLSLFWQVVVGAALLFVIICICLLALDTYRGGRRRVQGWWQRRGLPGLPAPRPPRWISIPTGILNLLHNHWRQAKSRAWWAVTSIILCGYLQGVMLDNWGWSKKSMLLFTLIWTLLVSRVLFIGKASMLVEIPGAAGVISASWGARFWDRFGKTVLDLFITMLVLNLASALLNVDLSLVAHNHEWIRLFVLCGVVGWMIMKARAGAINSDWKAYASLMITLVVVNVMTLFAYVVFHNGEAIRSDLRDGAVSWGMDTTHVDARANLIPPQTSPSPTTEKHWSTPAHLATWTATNIEVKAGETWRFAGDGSMQCDPGNSESLMNAWTGPDGVTGQYPTDLVNPVGFPRSDAQTCSLLIKVRGQVHAVGNQTEITFNEGGTVYAGVNDRRGYWNDNNGSYNITGTRL